MNRDLPAPRAPVISAPKILAVHVRVARFAGELRLSSGPTQSSVRGHPVRENDRLYGDEARVPDITVVACH